MDPNNPPTNLAQLKRFVKPGDMLHGVWYLWRERQNIAQQPVRLIVDEVNTRGLIFRPRDPEKDRRRSYSDWQKAGCYRFTTTGFSVHDEHGDKYAEYAYTDEREDAR